MRTLNVQTPMYQKPLFLLQMTGPPCGGFGPNVRCRTRLLPAGSKERFCRARTLIFITVVRGVHRFALYRTLGWRVARPPSSGEPALQAGLCKLGASYVGSP